MSGGEPRWTSGKRPCVDVSKAAIGRARDAGVLPMTVRARLLSRRTFVRQIGGVGPLLFVLGCSCSCGGCLEEYIPRREVVTPVLNMNVDLSSPEVQSETFSVDSPGRYSVNARLELRHGPQGNVASDTRFGLAGTVTISPVQETGETWIRDFELELTPAEIGGQLFTIEIEEPNVGTQHRFTISTEVSPAFREHYSAMRVFVRRELKHPILD